MIQRQRIVPGFVLIAVLSGYLAGGIGASVAVIILSLPPLAWAFDNRSGTFLVLAVLFVITVGIMVLLIALLALAS